MLSPVSFAGRVAVTYVQGPPKGGGALWQRGVTNTRLHRRECASNRMEVPVRTQTIFMLSGLLLLSACGASDADYLMAVKRHWPGELAVMRQRADFAENMAKKFAESAARSAQITARLRPASVGDEVAKAHLATSKDNQAEADQARYLSNSTVTAVRDVRCAPAEGVPGDVCEMTVTIKGPDGKPHDVPGRWRFDQVGGSLAVVGR